MNIIKNDVFVKYEGEDPIVKIPLKIKFIKDGAFENNTTLSKVVLKRNVMEIGERAFKGCTNLSAISFPDSLTTIKKDAFKGCTNLYKIDFGTGLKTIEDGAFENCTNLRQIFLNENLIEIGERAFKGCTELISLIFSSTVKIVKKEAFERCINLFDLELNNEISTIEDRAFGNCPKIVDVTLPSKLQTLGENAFFFPYYKISKSNKFFSTLKGSLYNKDKTALIKTSFYGDCEATLAPTVEKICSYAFSFSGLETLKLPESVKEIEEKAFYYCFGLKEVQFPDTLEKIDKEAFYNCGNLKRIKIPSEIKEIGERAFFNTIIKDIKIPIGLEYIGKNAFPCTANITVHDYNKNYSSFNGCLYNKDKTELMVCSYKLDGRITLLDTVKVVDENAFGKNDLLLAVTIPASVTSLDCKCFKDCPLLLAINVAEDNELFYSKDGILYTKDKSTLLKVPSNVEKYNPDDFFTNIGEYAFYGCVRLKTITIPEGIKCINNLTFHRCKKLITLNLPSTLEKIINVYDNKVYHEEDSPIFNKTNITYKGATYNSIKDLPLEIINNFE